MEQLSYLRYERWRMLNDNGSIVEVDAVSKAIVPR